MKHENTIEPRLRGLTAFTLELGARLGLRGWPGLRGWLGLLGLVGLLGANTALAATGGPDCFGYTWADQASGCSSSVPAQGGGTQSFPTATGVVGPFDLGFTMPWYGRPVSQVWVSPSGYVTFSDQGGASNTPQVFPDAAAPNDIFAAYWLSVANADISVEARADVFHVRWVQRRTAGSTLVNDIHLLIRSDGSFRLLWQQAFDIHLAHVGHENADGSCGRWLYGPSSAREGGNFPHPGAGSSACIEPPTLLDCSAPTVALCGDSIASSLPASDPSPASVYSCSNTAYFGNERVFQVDITAAAAVSVAVDDPALSLLGLDDMPCAEDNCRVDGGARIDYPILFPGSYLFAVDKEAAGGGDAFNFGVTCIDPFASIACGGSVAGDTSGGASVFDRHACAAPVLDGPEALFRTTLAATESLIATVASVDPNLWVIIYDAAQFEMDGTGCIAAGRGGAGAFDVPPGDYVIVVDGEAGAAAPFELSLACGNQLDCADAVAASCSQTISGDTSASTNDVSVYACSSATLKGAEDVYRFINPIEQTINVRFLSSQPGQQVLLLPTCDEGECLLSGEQGVSCALFPPGEYFIVVDGTEGSEGPYELAIECAEFLAGVDLRVTELDVTGLTGACNVFDAMGDYPVSGDALVTVSNLGDAPANPPFDVVVFEDRDLDGVYSPAADNTLGSLTVSTALAGGESRVLAVPSSGTLLFRDNAVFAAVDSGSSVAEVDESNNLLDTGRACEFRPPVGEFSPEVEWWFDGSSIPPDQEPTFREVDTIPLVGDVDADGIPNVVISAGPTEFTGGVVRVLDGRDGSLVWTAVDPMARVWVSSNLALGEIDGDPGLEIIGHSNQDRNRLVAIDDDGTFLWLSEPFVNHPAGPVGNGVGGGGGASIADLDCDGIPEIVYGANVFDVSGGYYWQPVAGGTVGANAGIDGALSVVADVDLDGTLEVIAGPTAYKLDPITGEGRILWQNADVPDGTPAVGNFDSDDFPEIAITASGTVYLLEGDTGELIWQRRIPCGGGGCGCSGVAGGAPTIADFDGDCAAEVGVAGADWYVVLETDGTIKWQVPINDCSSNRTASSVFDFDGDGAAEVAFMDETDLHVFRGSDGQEIVSLPAASHTWTEMLSIADVDADNNAEIIIPLNPCFAGGRCDAARQGFYGVQVIGDTDDNWVNTRRIWNQHQYHIDNVLDNGQVPGPLTSGGCERNSWQRHNTYRDQLGEAIYTAADITISITNTEFVITDECMREVTIQARVGNGGGINVGRNFSAWFYDGDPTAGGTPLAPATVISDLQPGEFEEFSITVPIRFGTIDIHAVADWDGVDSGEINECREDNNVCVVTVENTATPIDPPEPVLFDGLRVHSHGPVDQPTVTAVLDWTLDMAANPRTLGTGREEEHFHVLRSTDPSSLSLLSGIEPYLEYTRVDETPALGRGVHYYRVIAADGCEQIEQP